MIFSKIFGIFKKQEDMRDSPHYLFAEFLIKDAMKKGIRSINLKCRPKEICVGDEKELSDLLSDLYDEDPYSAIKIRHRNYVFGVSLRANGKDMPFMIPPLSMVLPLLNIFSSEKTEYKGTKCFAIYERTSSGKTIEKYLDLTLYWESDSSISIDFEEIK